MPRNIKLILVIFDLTTQEVNIIRTFACPHKIIGNSKCRISAVIDKIYK